MKIRPIIFSSESIAAILAGRKTQTRRPLRFPMPAYGPDVEWIQSVYRDGKGNWIGWEFDTTNLADFTLRAYPNGGGFPCPYGKPGDGLWVREAWNYITLADNESADKIRPDGVGVKTLYRADAEAEGWAERLKWQSPLFMPRWMGRLELRITNVRAQRLHAITVEDVIAEGGPFGNAGSADDDFAVEWDAVNARRGFPFSGNPWVWVVEFVKIPF